MLVPGVDDARCLPDLWEACRIVAWNNQLKVKILRQANAHVGRVKSVGASEDDLSLLSSFALESSVRFQQLRDSPFGAAHRYIDHGFEGVTTLGTTAAAVTGIALFPILLPKMASAAAPPFACAPQRRLRRLRSISSAHNVRSAKLSSSHSWSRSSS